jgi:putative colanic acid biosysnthesis UDP-glucose lipid carrier transferase
MIVNKKSIFISITLFDFILLNASFIIAAVIAQPSELILERSQMFLFLLILNIVWFFYTSSSGFYEEFFTRPFPIQLYNIIKLTILISIVSVFFLFLIKEPLYTRNFFFISIFLFLFTITFRTIVLKGILKTLRLKGKSVRNLLIIGAGDIGEKFRDIITKNPEIGYHFVGFINEDKTQDVIGKTSELDSIIRDSKIEEVVIALQGNHSQDLDDIVRTCNRNAVRVHIIPDYFKFLSDRFQISTVSNIPVITIRDEPLNEVMKRVIKRTFDIVFSIFIVIFILSWLIPIVSLLIKIDSRGPALFIQERFGVRNKKFNCYKFRTLANNKTNIEGYKPVLNEDPRITRIGKFLRKTNLDELPQFINVLKGEMSVVGPRPHAVLFEIEYEKIFEDIRMRYNVRPGITGWAQISGLRGDVKNVEENRKRTLERMKYDLWYIENWSLKLDFQIILITAWQMIKGDTKGF